MVIICTHFAELRCHNNNLSKPCCITLRVLCMQMSLYSYIAV